jgi:hypothetical protein
MNFKKNLSLIFAISIPVLMIIFVAAAIYIPQLFVKPQYNFLYLTGNNTPWTVGMNGQPIYVVKYGKLIKSEDAEKCLNNCINQCSGQCAGKCQYNCSDSCPNTCSDIVEKNQLKIYLYDMVQGQAREISFSEAQGYNIDTSEISPDGFKIVSGTYESGFFPFFWGYSGHDYNSRYIQGNNISKKLNIQSFGQFLGWVKK